MKALRERIEAGPLPRAEAIELIESHGIKEGERNQTVYWLLHAAALEGILVVGPALDRELVYVAAPPERGARPHRGPGPARAPLPRRVRPREPG